MYTTFPGIQGYKIWGSNEFDYGYPKRHPRRSNEEPKKPKHKYRVNDLILDVIEGKVGRIRELLSWPDYLVVDSSTPTKSWVCRESHIEPLVEDIDESLPESLPFINDLDVSNTRETNIEYPEDYNPYNPLSTRITDITDTGDIIISKNEVDLANDAGICVTDTVNRHNKDIDELMHISDVNMQKTSDIETKTYDIEQKVEDLEKKQKRISKLSKLALLSRFL